MFSSIRKWLMFFRPLIRVTFHRFLLNLAFHSDAFHRLFREWFPVSRSRRVHLYSIAVTVQTLFLIVSQLPPPSICIAHFCTRNHPQALRWHLISMALSRCIFLCTVLGNVRRDTFRMPLYLSPVTRLWRINNSLFLKLKNHFACVHSVLDSLTVSFSTVYRLRPCTNRWRSFW